jgi:hypothetical protein
LALFIILPVAVSAHQATEPPVTEYPGSTLQGFSLDLDFDGIPTSVELSGWYNASGGPYVTDPNNPDSDGDNLSDGEEQLYDTNPLDWEDPGLYVKYRDDYQTRKYYAWQQHGNKFITHNSSSRGSVFRDIIVRRGTTLFVNGPSGATLTITKSKSSLTTLSVIENSCGGGWTIPIPSNATAGTYTLRAQKDNWTSNAFTLHVIFELNAPSQVDIDVLSYNERDANHSSYKKDEIAIYFDTSYEPYNVNYDPNNHSIYGWGIGWETNYLSRNVFENYVMPTVNGFSNRESAANALGNKVDQTLTIDWFKFPNSTDKALSWTTSDCTGHASLLATFHRSAGIASRPVVVDWKNSHYDTSTEVWVGSSWKVMRAYRSVEYQGSPDIPPSPPLVSGTITLRSRWDFGQQQYTQGASDMLLVAGSDWQWNQININYAGTKFRDYLTARPGQWTNPIKRWNWVQTPLQDYWGVAPPPVGSDCSTCGTAPIGSTSLEVNTNTHSPLLQTQSGLARLNRIVADYGVDTDGDGRYDQLVIEVEVEVTQPGSYTIGAVLNDTDPESRLGRMVDGITGAQVYLPFEAGIHTVRLTFGGRNISDVGIAGPYLVDQLWITALQNPEPHQLMENLIDFLNPHYLTTPYSLNDFENGGAALTNNYTHQTFDGNGDGYFDALTVNTLLNITEAGNYRVEAELVDSLGNLVDIAQWTGSINQVSLQFNTLLGQTTPYYLRNVSLYRDHQLIDFTDDNANVYSIGPLYNLGLSAAAVVTPTVTSATASDTNNDGKYDSLLFNVNVTIAVAGQYRLEGWLEGNDGTPISWQTSSPVSLEVGNQTMFLSFPGEAINASTTDGPYKLTALKVLFNNGYQVIDEVTVAYETLAYSFGSFAGAYGSNYALVDHGNADNWSASGTNWALTPAASYSPFYSWTDSPNGAYGSDATRLTSKSYAISNGAAAELSFQTCYNINTDGDQGTIELKGSGDWAAVPGLTYSGVSSGWVQRQHILPPVINSNNLAFRFAMSGNSSNNADGWYVDDVLLTFNYDVDNDGISNAIEAVDGVTLYPDTDGDGIPDYLDTDSDGDNIPDSVEGIGDPDKDGIPNFRDRDSDGDGNLDLDEGTGDADGDHIPDYLDNNQPNGDADDDTISNNHENIPGRQDADGDGVWNVADPDSDNDGIPDRVEAGDANVLTPPVDTDNDGLPDFIDLDSDNDGIPDSVEGAIDTDGDTIPNYLDLDSDGDGMLDAWENIYGFNPVVNDANDDADGDGLTNGEEYNLGTHPLDPDTDNDGIPDGSDPHPGRIISDTFMPIIIKNK